MGELHDQLRKSIAHPRRSLGRYLVGVGRRAAAAPLEPQLVRAARQGSEAAREELIDRCLPLVLRLAREHRVDGLDLTDLVQEGIVGVLRALSRFDPERGVPFEAYALWWIRQGLQELRSDFVRPFRLPPPALRRLAQVKSEHARIYATEHREPALAELAERTGVDAAQVEALLRADARVRSTFEAVDGGDGEVGLVGDLLHDPLSAAAYEEVLDAIEGEELRALVGHLSDREREVVAARFGLDGREPERLAEIGERYGISAERVRQIEERALAKLRRGSATG